MGECIEVYDLVSVIMPSYNTGKYIKDAIQSVLNQTYLYWELIIVDDCSCDNTDEVVMPFLIDRRIHYLKNEINRGAAVSRNRALDEAKGRWIAFLDSDDLWLPDKMSQQIKFMQEKNCAFSYTKYEEIDENGQSIGLEIGGPLKISKLGMYSYCWPGCLTVMYDRSIVGNIRIVDIKKNNDYAMWLKICKKADCYLYDKVTAKYRKRVGSISRHGYGELIKWHYRLYRESEGKNIIVATVITIINVGAGVYKKLRYRRSVKQVNQ